MIFNLFYKYWLRGLGIKLYILNRLIRRYDENGTIGMGDMVGALLMVCVIVDLFGR